MGRYFEVQLSYVARIARNYNKHLSEVNSAIEPIDPPPWKGAFMVASPSPTHMLDVRGDFACFARPELAVERYSYPCPTPSAARGIFEAIYFKPQFRWQVTQIELLSPPSYIALRRNEVK